MSGPVEHLAVQALEEVDPFAALFDRIEAGELTIDALRGVNPDLNEAYGETEAACVVGHLRSIFAGPHEIRSFLSDRAAIARVIELRKLLASSLVTCGDLDGPFPFALRNAFGMLTEAHEAAVRQAIRGGRLSECDACRLAFNGDLLALFLGSPTAPAPLSFETSLGNSCRPPVGLRHPVLPLTTGGCRFRVIVSNGYELWRAINFKALEPETLHWIDTMTAGDVLYDVGANIGIFSLYAAAKSPAIEVVAFEPEPLNFARINENIALNGVGNVVALPLALSDQRGIGAFASRTMAPGSTSPVATAGGGDVVEHRAGCVLETLDGVAAMHSRPPTHIKIDVDGTQIAVLKGAQRTLANPRLRHLLVELFEDETAAVDAMLVGLGLSRTECRFHTEPIGGRGRVGNFIYSRSN